MLQTHPDFKSLVPEVQDAETMEDCLFEALEYQETFDKRTNPWENKEFDDILQNFEIDLEKVDRLYHIQYISNPFGREFSMIARMQYQDKPLYVELFAGCDFTGFECQGRGVIFISRDANIFMNLVLTEQEDLKKNLIYASLKEDGIDVEEKEEEYNNCSRWFLKNAPPLKYLCHKNIYENVQMLPEYRLVLPKILADSIDEFIKMEEAKKSYNEY